MRYKYGKKPCLMEKHHSTGYSTDRLFVQYTVLSYSWYISYVVLHYIYLFLWSCYVGGTIIAAAVRT